MNMMWNNNKNQAAYKKDGKVNHMSAEQNKTTAANIEFAYAHEDMNVYTYNYIWSKELEKSVKAQELLETKYAEAVEMYQPDYYQVDYNKLPPETTTSIIEV